MNTGRFSELAWVQVAARGERAVEPEPVPEVHGEELVGSECRAAESLGKRVGGRRRHGGHGPRKSGGRIASAQMGSARQPCASGAGDPSLPHEELAWARSSSEGRDWLERLPSLVAESAAEWSLELGDPFPDAYASLALPATLPDGGDAVLKVCFPHRESEHEAAALGRWDGNGAVRLLAHSPERWALLIERCQPGRH